MLAHSDWAVPQHEKHHIESYQEAGELGGYCTIVLFDRVSILLSIIALFNFKVVGYGIRT